MNFLVHNYDCFETLFRLRIFMLSQIYEPLRVSYDL